MTAKHTPGPWHAMQKLSPCYSDHGYRLVADVRGMCIYAEAANMILDGKYVWGDKEVDASLIAAVPDLLAALCAMVSAQHAGPITDEMLVAWRQGKAAIAKATGDIA